MEGLFKEIEAEVKNIKIVGGQRKKGKNIGMFG